MLPLIKQFVASCFECQSMKESQPIPKVHYPRIPLDTRLMAVTNYSISELELTGVMANVAAFKHLLRNANFHVYCDHSALVQIHKAKREPLL